jgi:uncharacterized protein (UPF0333 family)
MFNNKFNKKAQAAIEFLMTYGWMLLVVLIVGALVFSFVDFGSLLPDNVAISTQSIKGDSTNSYALSSSNLAVIAFTYTGGQKSTIDLSDITLVNSIGNSCKAINITNDNTGAHTLTVSFLSGQVGTATFNCSVSSGGAGAAAAKVGDLTSGDVLEGIVALGVKDAKRPGAVAKPSTGSYRISIQ